ncbi:tetratricopeptide repeat protein [Metabacillus elymi]|uniref:Tetratricopeptide repeat protein n=1 Tax=Metabacillus elymi TaxID=2745198 RepID=A0ABX6SF78_9BACI|nr:hypothetical protein [Metabacillus sp. KUDC1714]QNF30506.1 hypothetical protein HUW50_25390 [Metabacillus sp. KUDC1714]
MGKKVRTQYRQNLISTLIKSNPYIRPENVLREIEPKQEVAAVLEPVKELVHERVQQLVDEVVDEPVQIPSPESIPAQIQLSLEALVDELVDILVQDQDQSFSNQNNSIKTENSNKSNKSKVNGSYSNQTREKNVNKEQSQVSSKVSIPQNEPLNAAIELHNEGIMGNKQAVKSAYNSLKDLAKQDKNNLEIQAYLGSATTLLGRDANSVTDKMKYALEGLKLLDAVVESAPNLVIARLLRGNVSFRLPEMYFQRTSTAIEDFSFLVQAYEKDSSILTESEYNEVLKNVIEACKRSNQLEKASMFQNKSKTVNGEGKVKGNSTSSKQSSSKSSTKAKKNSKGKGLTDEAINIYERALNGSSVEVQEAIEFFENFVLTNSAPEVEMAYLDVQSMQGRDSINTYDMFGSAIKSLKAMDSLVNEYPSNRDLRLVRANHSLRLPENFFRRAATAVSDIEFLLKEYENDPTYLTEETYHQLLFDLGCAYERLEMIAEANETWNRLLKTKTSLSEVMQQKVYDKREVYAFQEINLSKYSTSNKDQFYNMAKELHYLGAKGSKKAAKQSLEAWEKALKAYPNCEVANTYYAASAALMGKHASDPQEMFGETIKALKILKTSIKTDNPELLYLRGSIYHALPEGFFHSSDKAIKDLKAVKSAYESNREKPRISHEQYVKLLFDLGQLYKKTSFLDNAEKTFITLLKVAPESKYAQRLVSQGVNKE